jgi:cytochrome c peroxidase
MRCPVGWLFLIGSAAWAQGSLKNVTYPKPDITPYVQDEKALIVLGKALFWDMQLGSDGRVACASCHFHAGADHRVQNQLSNPFEPFLANYLLTALDFPIHSAQRVGSSGVFRRAFAGAAPGDVADSGQDLVDLPAFRIGGLNVRQVTLRNTPTVINAVFNYRTFWDGRASNIFTGLTPFGDSDPRQNVLRFAGGELAAEPVRIANAPLASQAVGPPLSSIEMAYEGRTWPLIGKRILTLIPLAQQIVASDDSVLGEFANPEGRGFAPQYSYLDLVKAAFLPAWWNGGVEQAQNNFALFFGLAIQAYESTLVSDESRFDANTLTREEQNGFQVFLRVDCTECHNGPEFTEATYTGLRGREAVRQRTGVDTGFFRTGVRPAAEDNGLNGTDDFGKPFSITGAPGRVDGAFKTPGLRNVEFTGPYFHNGGAATLEQVMEFYNRGGDFPQGNLGPDIRRLGLGDSERAAVVAFLKSLTDDRVRFERAPFDHPELCVPAANTSAPAEGGAFPLSAGDKWAGIPAVGRGGNQAPLQTFEELLLGIGADGSRTHTLTDSCGIF